MSKDFSFWKFLPLLAAFAVVLFLPPPAQPSNSALSGHLEHRVTNISDVAFTVSWTTEVPCRAFVEYGETPSLGKTDYDDRGQDTTDDTHHISIGHLMPETLYYYDIICDGIRYDNGGKHYSVTTGPTILPKLPKAILGQVLKADGQTPAEGSIVYLQVVDNDGKGSPAKSQEWSRLVESNGYWSMTFGTLRTVDLESWFEFDNTGGDSFLLTVEGAADGKSSQIVPTGEARRLLPSMTLQIAESKGTR